MHICQKKSEIFITEALSKAPCCKIRGGLLHRNAISVDHIERKQDGGKATIENAQLTPPYCNTEVKNYTLINMSKEMKKGIQLISRC